MQNVVAASVVLMVLVPGLWWVSNTRLAAATADVDDCWADVDAELQRRYELVAELVESLRNTARPDLLAELSDRLDAARSAPRAPLSANAYESSLVRAIDEMLATEAGPSGPADRNHVAEIDQQLGVADERIAAAGSFYNSRVAQLNRRVDSWPSTVVARRHGFDRADFFDI